MKRTRTPLNGLRAFEVAARHLSLSGAAGELAVSPAAVSQQIRALEQRLGQRLFVRHARGLRLTLAGEALLPACRECFDRLDTAVADLFGARHPGRLLVRVAFGFARRDLLAAIAAFARAHPQITVRIAARVWSVDTPDEDVVDADIRLGSGPPAGGEAYPLTRDELFPVCSPAATRPRQPADLRAHALLGTVGFAQGWPQWFAAAGVPRPWPTPSLQFDSMRLALETAALGAGVALARSSYVQDFLKDRSLRILFGPRVRTRDDIWLLLPRGAPAGSPVALFRDWVLGRVAVT